MRRLAFALPAYLLAAAPLEARAEHGPFGLGLILGSPTGITAKYYMAGDTAIDAAVGFSLLNKSGGSVHADFLWHPIVLVTDDAFTLPFYFGVGGRILDHDRDDGDLHLGVRVPGGILFDFTQVPLELFVEAALIVDVIAEEGHGRIDFNAGLGARYYF